MQWKPLVITIYSITLALIVGAVIILVGKHNPLEAYQALLKGALGSKTAATETLLRATPLILTGLAVGFAFKGGLFNIGGEGQFLIGGLLASIAAFSIKNIPPFIHLPLVLFAGALGGALYGAIPGCLKAKLGVHEVINTIMLNWVALYLVMFLVNNPFKDPSGLGTPAPLASATIPTLISGSRLHIGLILAIITALFIWFILSRTVFGYEIKGMGHSLPAAEYGGITIGNRIVLTMAIAGSMAGLAGSMEYIAVLGRIPSTLWFSGYGFEGIAVALVGKNHPLGIILSALLFGALGTGGTQMQLTANISKEITGIIQALVILFVVAPDIIKHFFPFLKERVTTNAA